MTRRSLSIQRPPIVKNLAVAVPLLGKTRTGPHLFAAHPFEPTLALTVFGILDVLACVQEGLFLKPPIHITAMRRIARKLDNGQSSIRLFLPLPAAIPPPRPAQVTWSFLMTLQERCGLLV